MFILNVNNILQTARNHHLSTNVVFIRIENIQDYMHQKRYEAKTWLKDDKWLLKNHLNTVNEHIF